MTARLMDLIVRYHELPKGEIVTKRDEIARELASYWALSKQRVWDMLIDAHTCLAERDQLLHEIDKSPADSQGKCCCYFGISSGVARSGE